MTIRLGKELEMIVNEAMRSGQYACKTDVIRDALTRLKREMPQGMPVPEPRAKGASLANAKQTPLKSDELNQRLLAAGLVCQPPDPAQDIDDDADDLPLVIQGEPLSETIIGERC